MSASAPSGSSGGRLSGAIALAIVVALAAISFVILWLAFPSNGHFLALLAIGVLALLYALLSYFVQAFTSDPTVVRAAGWGLFGMGGAVLILTLAFDSPAPVNVVAQLVGIMLVLLVLLVGFVGAAWRGRARGADRSRQQKQEEWRSRPAASAFNYSTAQPPAVSPPPNPSNVPPGAGGNP